MQSAQASEIEFRRPGTRHREGDISFKHLLRGVAGSPQNYELMIAHSGAGFPSPPHHHNFDQIRFCLQGEFGGLREGQCGYYPEGAWYSIDSTESQVLLLQFGGASGSGFVNFPQLFKAYEELSQRGEFREGRFHPSGQGAEAQSTDGYEALWEHINGRKLSYPQPRYANPIVMQPDAFAWTPIAEGVQEKNLGIFSERMLGIFMLKVASGISYSLSATRTPTLLYVLSGPNPSTDEPWREGAAAELSPGEDVVIRGSSEIVVALVRLHEF